MRMKSDKNSPVRQPAGFNSDHLDERKSEKKNIDTNVTIIKPVYIDNQNEYKTLPTFLHATNKEKRAGILKKPRADS